MNVNVLYLYDYGHELGTASLVPFPAPWFGLRSLRRGGFGATLGLREGGDGDDHDDGGGASGRGDDDQDVRDGDDDHAHGRAHDYGDDGGHEPRLQAPATPVHGHADARDGGGYGYDYDHDYEYVRALSPVERPPLALLPPLRGAWLLRPLSLRTKSDSGCLSRGR